MDPLVTHCVTTATVNVVGSVLVLVVTIVGHLVGFKIGNGPAHLHTMALIAISALWVLLVVQQLQVTLYQGLVSLYKVSGMDQCILITATGYVMTEHRGIEKCTTVYINAVSVWSSVAQVVYILQTMVTSVGQVKAVTRI